MEKTTEDPSTDELLTAAPGTVDTQRLTFVGLRGDPRCHWERSALEAALAALPAPPRDVGTVDLLVARGPSGERHLPREALLTVDGGMHGDRWASEDYGPDFQLATTRTDFARVIAKGQPLPLHGDNLYLTLDLSTDNLPPGSLVRLGRARLEVTPQAHNGCKKWAQRFGLSPMRLNMTPQMQRTHLRGIYLRVVEAGVVEVGDLAVVERRADGRSPTTDPASASPYDP